MPNSLRFPVPGEAPAARRRAGGVGVLLALVLTPLLVSCEHTERGHLDPGSLPGVVQAEEYAVYRDLLLAWLPEGGNVQVVIQDSTETAYGGGLWLGPVEDLVENMPGLEPKTFADLLSRSEKPALLQDRFDLGIPTTILPDREWNEIFGGGGWNEYYRRYPGAHGLIELSRVGFNAAGDQALFYIGTMFQPLAGAGYLVLMQKTDGVWVEADSVMMWVS